MSTADSLDTFLSDTRTRVDEALKRHLPAPPECPAIIADAMSYSVFAGGKRLRPALTLAAADAIARRQGTVVDAALTLALPAACAIEMIHTYSLVHDDLPAMDNDVLRRGRPTLHVVFGDGIAILAGDALQAEAFALLGREPAGDSTTLGRRLRTIDLIARAAGAIGMVGGQAIDLQAAGQAPGASPAFDLAGLEAMHARKTGALIRAAAAGGAVMAGGDDGLVGAIDRYATDLGLAFQIVDDILDVEGSAAELGKTTGKDAAGMKPTYPALVGIDRSRRLAEDCVARARATLGAAQLTGGWLIAIAEWALTRRN